MPILPLSVAMISFNEEANIARTLESVVGIASEIIVVDSHSSDRTVEIAQRYGARVFTEDWKGHIDQKNSALAKCTMEWILCIDCDEVLTEDLQQSIKEVVTKGSADGYTLNRRTVYLGKILRYAWQPDRKLRLVRRISSPLWGGYNPHDVLEIKGSIAKIPTGELLHYSYRDIRQHFEKTIYYAYHTAQSYHTKGRKPSLGKMLLSPLFSFARNYLFQRGFLDGIPGLIAGVSAFVYVFLKYAFLWEISHSSKHVDGNG